MDLNTSYFNYIVHKYFQSERVMKEMVEQLPPTEKDKYLQIVEENNKTLQGIDSLQEQIKQQKERSEYLKSVIGQSQVK